MRKKVSNPQNFFSYNLLIQFIDLHEALHIVSQECNELHIHGRHTLEVAYFGYGELASKLVAGAMLDRLVQWVQREQSRLLEELSQFPQVDQEGRLLVDLEEEEEKETGEEAEKVAGGSRKGKEVACN